MAVRALIVDNAAFFRRRIQALLATGLADAAPSPSTLEAAFRRA